MTHSAALALSTALLLASTVLGQSTSTTLEPYNGPPIYIEAPAEPVPATRVTHKISSNKYDDGQVWTEQGIIQMSDDTFVSHGVYREFYRDGQQFVDGNYAEGKPAGEWTYWHANGQIAKKVRFKDGRPDGIVEVSRDNGVLSERKSYSAGSRDGKWQKYFEDGESLATEGIYKSGKESGEWRSWYEDGQIRSEIRFEDGKMNGVSSEWYKDGSPKASVSFKDGKRHGLATQWSAEGEKTEVKYAEGRVAKE